MENLRDWVVCHVGVENAKVGVGVLFDDPFVSCRNDAISLAHIFSNGCWKTTN